MARLVGEAASVKFICAAPFGHVVVVLRTRPEDVGENHIDFAESAFFVCSAQQLDAGVEAVLFDDHVFDFRFVRSFYRLVASLERTALRLFGEDVFAGFRRLYCLVGVEP
ncbi:hypothetical protein SDC9_193751 [bioreactor metagenome]|uniref:Uncharacterized protein n=1 Tax=bioreactor metagenome TaxID=1076179 RepID=A0A645I4I4_9ZZZZ